jgi:mono/diheme cytochrome c family protein
MLSRLLLATAIIFATHPAVACPPQNVACQVQYAPVQRVVKQQVVQYAAPVVNHAYQQQAVQHYGYQNQVVVKQLAYAPPQYWSVGAGLQEEAITERIVSKALARLDAKLDAASERIDRRGDDRFSEHPGLKVAQVKCAMCHSEGSKDVTEGGAPKLFTGLGEWLGNAAQAEKAIEAARSGQMPPKDRDKAMLDDDEYLALKQYISQVAK